MENIITPLDNINDLVKELQKHNNSTRRGSSHDNILENILANVNSAKNNILFFLSDCQKSAPPVIQPAAKISEETKSFKQNKTQKLIIPLTDHLPNKEQITKAESKIVDIIKQSNIQPTIINTAATENGNIIVKFEKDDNLDSIKEPLKTEFGSIKMKKPLMPKIKVISVPSYFDTSDKNNIVSYVSEQNPFIKPLLNDENNSFEFLFDYDVNNHKTLIFKCSPNIRSALHKNNDKIKIGFSLCKIYDHIHVARCSKCCRFGHSFKNCKSETFSCMYCAQSHNSKDCPHKNSSENHACTNCSSNKNNNHKQSASTHKTFSYDCPIYKLERNRIISRTDFGIHPPS